VTAMKYDTVVKGGLVVTAEGESRLDVGIKGERVAELAPEIPSSISRRTVDASGRFVLPGIIDAHNHPVSADRIDTFSESAAYGGITTVVPFIRNRRDEGVDETTAESVQAFIDEAMANSRLDFGVHAILLGDDVVEDQVPRLIGMGVTSFKMFMTYPRRGIMMPDDRMLVAMQLAADGGGLAMVHAENGYGIDHLVERFSAANKRSAEYLAQSQPRLLEAEAVNRAATYATITGCPLYVVHLSARESMDVIRRFKDDGLRLYGETCPQYLTLTDETTREYGALAKIGPPLREREDNDAMWGGLADGTIDVVASDFCGYTRAQKMTGGQSSDPAASAPEKSGGPTEENIFDARFGGNWAEQMLPVVYHHGVNGGHITLPRLVEVMCESPARIFGLYPAKGTIAVGSDADLVVFDPSVRHTLGAASQHTNADFTMFEGMEVLGAPVFTMQRGEVLLEDGQLKRPRGCARYLPGNLSQTGP
jgi:dihydropyrimidinase